MKIAAREKPDRIAPRAGSPAPRRDGEVARAVSGHCGKQLGACRMGVDPKLAPGGTPSGRNAAEQAVARSSGSGWPDDDEGDSAHHRPRPARPGLEGVAVDLEIAPLRNAAELNRRRSAVVSRRATGLFDATAGWRYCAITGQEDFEVHEVEALRWGVGRRLRHRRTGRPGARTSAGGWRRWSVLTFGRVAIDLKLADGGPGGRPCPSCGKIAENGRLHPYRRATHNLDDTLLPFSSSPITPGCSCRSPPPRCL